MKIQIFFSPYSFFTYLDDMAGKAMNGMAIIRKLQSNMDNAIRKLEKRSRILGLSKTTIDIIVPMIPKIDTIKTVIPSI